MKRPLVGLMFTLIASTLAGCHHFGYHKQRDVDDMILNAQAVDRQFVKTFSRGDLDGLMDLYWNSPDLVVYPPNAMEAHGWDQVKAGYAELFRTMPGVKLEIHDSQYHVQGDVVLGNGLWTMTMASPPDSSGPPQQLFGRYTEVIGRRDGKWVYMIDHPSTPLQQPTTQPAATQPATQPR
jgi:ketosteroid isomerase-like protein